MVEGASCHSIFPQTSFYSEGTTLSSPPHNPFLVGYLCHPGYCVSFCCPSIGDSLVGNVLLSVSGFHTVISWHQMSVG